MTRTRQALQPPPVEVDDLLDEWERSGRPMDLDTIARETQIEERRIRAGLERRARRTAPRARGGYDSLEAALRQLGGQPTVEAVAKRMRVTPEHVRATLARISGLDIAEVVDGRVVVLVPQTTITGWGDLSTRRRARRGVDATRAVTDGVAHE